MTRRDVDLSISIGTVVQRWRLARGLTLTELALRAGPPVTKAYLSQVEHGKVQHPGPQHLIALAKALDVPIGWLLTRQLPGEDNLNVLPNPQLQSPEPFVTETWDGRFRITIRPQTVVEVEDLTGDAGWRHITLEGSDQLESSTRRIAEGLMQDHALRVVVDTPVPETVFYVTAVAPRRNAFWEALEPHLRGEAERTLMQSLILDNRRPEEIVADRPDLFQSIPAALRLHRAIMKRARLKQLGDSALLKQIWSEESLFTNDTEDRSQFVEEQPTEISD